MIVAKGGPKFIDHEWRDPVPGTVSFSFKPISMDYFAAWLSDRVDFPVVNKTGLPGKYNIQLQTGEKVPPPRGMQGAVAPLPIKDALRDQLGLALEFTKTTVDVLVIDRIQKKPSKE